ncbi:Signal recognition particle subunit SRP68-like [Homarus americanus]|uniref:Signal recognition particle subunit SRP68-like n=1 Tax=Homarus americanus TaxID=6706 RepID=A0A8J5MTL5_HOMAM|nr:Signal recognition particle subunit SRP68-like [Homarus americanus]
MTRLEDDLQLKQSIEGQVLAYKAHRCYFVAESFVKMEKWAEALVLYERTLAHIKAADKSQMKMSMVKGLENLSVLVDSKKFTAHAQAILASESSTPNVSKLSTKGKKLLVDRLDEYIEDSSLTSNSPNVAQVPSPMTSVPCKPLFFDLALNHVDFPSLDDKTETKKQASGAGVGGGLTGLVKGLWGGWGSKK